MKLEIELTDEQRDALIDMLNESMHLQNKRFMNSYDARVTRDTQVKGDLLRKITNVINGGN